MVGLAEAIFPGPHADMAEQVGHDRNDVVGGGPNFLDVVAVAGGMTTTTVAVVAGVVAQEIKLKLCMICQTLGIFVYQE